MSARCNCSEPFRDVGPDGATCARGHFTPRDPDGRLNGKSAQSLVLPLSVEPSASTPPRFPLLSAADVLSYEAPPDLVAGMIPSNAIAVVSGDFGTFKSFVTLDKLASVAAGREWAGRRVRQGRVVYCFGEGRDGLRKRVKAWQIARGCLFPSVPLFTFVPAVPHALDPLDIDRFKQALAPVNDGIVAVALDTLSLTIPGAQENGSDVMTRAVALAADIRTWTGGATVFLIHHVGKMGDSARGHSSLLGNADAELKFSRAERGDVVTITCGKLKDGPEFEPIELRRRTVELGSVDAYGVPETSLVLDFEPTSGVSKVTDSVARVGQILLETFGAGGATASQWETVAVEAKVSRASYFRAKTALVNAGIVLQEGDGGRGTRYRHAETAKVSMSHEGLNRSHDTDNKVSLKVSHTLVCETLRPIESDDTELDDELPWPEATAVDHIPDVFR